MSRWTNEEFDKAVELLNEGLNYGEIGERINKSYDSVRNKLFKNGYSFNVLKHEVRSCKECDKEFEVLKSGEKQFCGRSCSASYTNRNKEKKERSNCLNCDKKLDRLGNKYCSNTCQGQHKRKEVFKLIEGGDLTLHENSYRRFMIHKHGANCMKCGWNEKNEQTGLVPIHMDHIDGNSDNNHLDNLRLLCPNCHSLTPNYGSLNKGNGRGLRNKKRRERRAKEKKI